MLYGPVEIRSCPSCKALGRVKTIASGNSIRAKGWSDGFTVAPFNKPGLLITQCHSCSKIFWIETASLESEIDDWTYFEDRISQPGLIRNRLRKILGIKSIGLKMWSDSKWLAHLNKEQLIEAIENKLWNSLDEEAYLRQNLWWKMNDDVRSNSSADLPQNETVIFESNLRALIDIFDNDESGIILKAEAHRELGEFETSTKILFSLQMDKESLFRDLIEKANGERDRKVLMIYDFT